MEMNEKWVVDSHARAQHLFFTNKIKFVLLMCQYKSFCSVRIACNMSKNGDERKMRGVAHARAQHAMFRS